jgi:AcrR family transcriptional regulator
MADDTDRRRGPYAKSAARREQIVDEAYRLFATRGYLGSSLREIAAAADVSLSTVQHHFSNKEELLVAVLARRDELGSEADRATLPFDENIVERARQNESIPGLIALFSILAAEAITEGHPAHPYFVERYDELRDRYTREFEALRTAGRLRDGVQPALAAATVVALWEGLQVQWLYAPEVIDAPGSLRAYLDLVIQPGR